MKGSLNIIEERKQTINELCSELRWVYRGYFTFLFTYVNSDNLILDSKQLTEKLISYEKTLTEKEQNLYRAFLLSSIVFLSKNCRPSEFNFLSIYKFATTVNESYDKKYPFNTSIYKYVCDNYNPSYSFYEEFTCYVKEFGELYDDVNISKENFSSHITSMFDQFLYDEGKSYLVDTFFKEGINSLTNYIGNSKYNMRRTFEEEI